MNVAKTKNRPSPSVTKNQSLKMDEKKEFITKRTKSSSNDVINLGESKLPAQSIPPSLIESLSDRSIQEPEVEKVASSNVSSACNIPQTNPKFSAKAHIKHASKSPRIPSKEHLKQTTTNSYSIAKKTRTRKKTEPNSPVLPTATYSPNEGPEISSKASVQAAKENCKIKKTDKKYSKWREKFETFTRTSEDSPSTSESRNPDHRQVPLEFNRSEEMAMPGAYYVEASSEFYEPEEDQSKADPYNDGIRNSKPQSESINDSHKAMLQAEAISSSIPSIKLPIVDPYVYSQDSDLQESLRRKKVRQRKNVLAMTLIVLLFMGIGIGLGISLSGKKSRPRVLTCSMDEAIATCSSGYRMLEIPPCILVPYTRLRKDFGSEIQEQNTCSPESLAFMSLAFHSDLTFANESLFNRYGLLTLYFSTQGHQWTKSENWLSEKKHCEWEHITCAEKSDAVVEINIKSNNLKGSIPKELLSFLPQLKYVDLSSNFINGTIPEQFTNLTVLRLGSNSFVGDLPHSLLKSQSLEVLSLENNPGLSIPKNSIFISGSNWKVFELGDVLFNTTFPRSFSSMPNLEVLKLGNTSLKGTLPLEYGLWGKLSFLSLSANSLSGELTHDLGNMTNLKHLEVVENKIQGTIPSEVGFLTQLTRLQLDVNSFKGTIPIEISRLTKLQILSFSDNKLTGTMPSELGRLSELKTFWFAPNFFTGELPKDICQLKGKMVEFGEPLKLNCESFGNLECPQSMPMCCCT